IADAGGPHRPDVRLKSVLAYRLTPVVVHQRWQKMVLQVGMRDARVAADERAGLQMCGRTEAGLEQEPLEPDRQAVHGVLGGIEGDRLPAGILHIELEVVLKITADVGQIVNGRNSM